MEQSSKQRDRTFRIAEYIVALIFWLKWIGHRVILRIIGSTKEIADTSNKALDTGKPTMKTRKLGRLVVSEIGVGCELLL